MNEMLKQECRIIILIFQFQSTSTCLYKHNKVRLRLLRSRNIQTKFNSKSRWKLVNKIKVLGSIQRHWKPIFSIHFLVWAMGLYVEMEILLFHMREFFICVLVLAKGWCRGFLRTSWSLTFESKLDDRCGVVCLCCQLSVKSDQTPPTLS